VAVGFLICALTPETVRLEPVAILVELRVFKYGTSGHAPRVALYVPTEGASDCYGALAMCMIGYAGPPTPSKYRMYHTLVAALAFLVISTIGPSATVLL
jgi:hypothetical protein